ncbi:YraN family protein [Corynebacterium aquilae]|uniref:Uncharacterized protein n=1 Tax=Corynebacterium aquilae DSM 44791 TaxID=1431546 RepID=A0A1L7CGQ6_9CORY|nr:YraN family protein [Corynebacterium aquilae]APT85004.1 hypothetical protein CAQU_07875 [Corynebacterium aquilae DSM 44791]
MTRQHNTPQPCRDNPPPKGPTRTQHTAWRDRYEQIPTADHGGELIALGRHLAAQFYIQRGGTIVETQPRIHGAKADLIVRLHQGTHAATDTLVVVDVSVRRGISFGRQPYTSAAKKQRLIAIAQAARHVHRDSSDHTRPCQVRIDAAHIYVLGTTAHVIVEPCAVPLPQVAAPRPTPSPTGATQPTIKALVPLDSGTRPQRSTTRRARVRNNSRWAA